MSLSSVALRGTSPSRLSAASKLDVLGARRLIQANSARTEWYLSGRSTQSTDTCVSRLLASTASIGPHRGSRVASLRNSCADAARNAALQDAHWVKEAFVWRRSQLTGIGSSYIRQERASVSTADPRRGVRRLRRPGTPLLGLLTRARRAQRPRGIQGQREGAPPGFKN